MTNIVPLAAARSDKALVAAAEKRRERWEKILVESAQQSRRLSAPRFGAVIGAEKAFASSRDAECRILLSERSEAEPLRNVLRGKTSNSVALAIGPEGGWTDGGGCGCGRGGICGGVAGTFDIADGDGGGRGLASVNFALGER